MVGRVLDDRGDRRVPRMRTVDHRAHLALELVETVIERLEELQVVDRIQMHDLHHVADDRVARREKSGGIDHRHRIVEHPQQLVEPERDALVRVVVARRRLNHEAQHVEPAEGDLRAARRVLDVAAGAQPLEPRGKLVA